MGDAVRSDPREAERLGARDAEVEADRPVHGSLVVVPGGCATFTDGTFTDPVH